MILNSRHNILSEHFKRLVSLSEEKNKGVAFFFFFCYSALKERCLRTTHCLPWFVVEKISVLYSKHLSLSLSAIQCHHRLQSNVCNHQFDSTTVWLRVWPTDRLHSMNCFVSGLDEKRSRHRHANQHTASFIDKVLLWRKKRSQLNQVVNLVMQFSILEQAPVLTELVTALAHGSCFEERWSYQMEMRHLLWLLSHVKHCVHACCHSVMSDSLWPRGL